MPIVTSYIVFLILTLPLITLGLDRNTFEFATDYFKYRDVKFICLLTCGSSVSALLQFSKIASNLTIGVSGVSLDKPGSNQLEMCLHRKLHQLGVFLDAQCEKSDDVLYFASRNMRLDATHKWLIIDDDKAEPGPYNNTGINSTMFDESNTGVIEVLRNLNISVDADIVLASDVIFGYNLYDIFNYGKIQGGNLIVNKIGSWNERRGLKLNADLNDYKYYRRWDFQNISMRLILVIQPAPKHFDPESLHGLQEVPGVARITHVSTAILYTVGKIHNMGYVHTITDRWVGTYEKNSSRVVSNSVYYREQDISPVIRPYTIINRCGFLNTPLTSIETRYYYLIPSKGPGKFENQFLRPLNPAAWWCVIGVSVLCALILLLTALVEQRPSSVQYAVFSVVASICQQFFQDIDDGGRRRVSTARKLTIFVTGLSCVLTYNYYTSSVVSWLLNGPPPSINSLKELLESPLELIYEDIGYTWSWLQTPKYYFSPRHAHIEDEIRQKKVFNKKKNAPLVEPLVRGIKMVQGGGYAYHAEVNSANTLISRTFTQTEICAMGSLSSMEKTMLHPALQLNSPFKEFLDWSLMRLSERGVVSCIQIRTSTAAVKCAGSSPRALALGGAAPAFILLAGGYLLAIIIMMVERYVYKMTHRRNGLNFK
ncbi:uncharacterized protein LOC113508736 [Trichoplusia ni]|uniref:Uncharacterized protein LOC113508736 n=1 Tax=Trichoplusia ni TaxID=7111 RepID=A0A7E5X323_TRINI|nr:uncharacterized protein LOC113508736 [Trichoplusia ni]